MNNLNYKHLRYFWMVARTGSIAKAAEQLHLTPQSISGQLTEFASVLGVELFRRAGRNLEITDAGRHVLTYAEEIFSLGDELLGAIHNQREKKSVPFVVGIADSVSKSVAYRLLEPALFLPEPIRLICREGRLVPLLSELSVHRLDMIIADRPMPTNLNVRGFTHLLGESGLTVFGAQAVIKNLRGSFPKCLDDAPFLLPGDDTATRAKLEHWFEKHNVHPRITGEFDDSALMKAFGQAGAGLFAAPATIAAHVEEQYDVKAIGQIKDVTEQLYVISTERQLTHPAIVAVSEKGRSDVFGARSKTTLTN
ncbi:MAG TPA: transcriptional activator NhaR [Cellvibrionaceae bacterium]|nr:transcriptional activator NhaR [Cellvibrionaceae bacterium]